MLLRITKGSGIYGMYYRLNRKHNFVLRDDIIVPEDTLTAGTAVSPFFNTEVYSLGYLFTILQKDKVFLGSFFNLYIMNIYTGFESNDERFDRGKINDLNLALSFLPAQWLGISLGFQVFDIIVYSYEDDYSMEVTYNFKGPALSLTVKF